VADDAALSDADEMASQPVLDGYCQAPWARHGGVCGLDRVGAEDRAITSAMSLITSQLPVRACSNSLLDQLLPACLSGGSGSSK
jgi:hypothetical protein